MDITCVQVHFVSDLILWSWNLALVVVLSHVFFGLCECGPGLQECGFHLVLEFIDSFKSGFYLVVNTQTQALRVLTGVTRSQSQPLWIATRYM